MLLNLENNKEERKKEKTNKTENEFPIHIAYPRYIKWRHPSCPLRANQTQNYFLIKQRKKKKKKNYLGTFVVNISNTPRFAVKFISLHFDGQFLFG